MSGRWNDRRGQFRGGRGGGMSNRNFYGGRRPEMKGSGPIRESRDNVNSSPGVKNDSTPRNTTSPQKSVVPNTADKSVDIKKETPNAPEKSSAATGNVGHSGRPTGNSGARSAHTPQQKFPPPKTEDSAQKRKADSSFDRRDFRQNNSRQDFRSSGNSGNSRPDARSEIQPKVEAQTVGTGNMDIPLGNPKKEDDVKAKYKNPSKCRLFVGNLPNTMTESDFKSLFAQYGEIMECFHNQSKGFGFIRMDTKYSAERAKDEIDGLNVKGRTLRCRLANQGSAIKLKNLPLHVSNEYLQESFEQFGQIENAVVVCDERGKSTGEGVIDFSRKTGAQGAVARINDGVFLIGTSPQPITAEILEHRDDEDGLQEKFVNQTPDVVQERESGARFVMPGSFEYEWGMRWKQLETMEKQQHDNLKKQMNEAREKLKFEMEDAFHDYQTNLMRQDLMRRQEELNRIEAQRAQEAQRRRQQFEQRFGGVNQMPGQGMGDIHADQDMRMQPMNPPPVPPSGAQMQEMSEMGMGMGMRESHEGKIPSRQSRFDQVPPGFPFQQQGNQFENFASEGEPRPLMGEAEFFENKRPRMF